MRPIIMQNQEHFSAQPYCDLVTPLPIALQKYGYPTWLPKLPLDGYLCGIFLFLLATRFNVIVTVSLPPSFMYGLLCRLFGKPRAVHLCKEFYLEASAKKMTFKKYVRLVFLRFALKQVDAIVLNASNEASYFSDILALPKDRFRFIHWPSNIDEPAIYEEDDGYFLAVGRSLRDWHTFFKAVENTPYKYVVVAGSLDSKTFPMMRNVTIRTDVKREEYLSLLSGAMAVVLPLKQTIRSTGQASFLEAMSYGKAVIAADVIGVQDYLINEKNALLYTPENYIGLREKIMQIANDPALRRKLAQAGLNDIKNKFNKRRYAEAMVDTITDLLRRRYKN